MCRRVPKLRGLARKGSIYGWRRPRSIVYGCHMLLPFVAHEFDGAAAFMDRGLAVNSPTLRRVGGSSAWLMVWRGAQPDLALEPRLRMPCGLSPLESVHGTPCTEPMAVCSFFSASRYDMASVVRRKVNAWRIPEISCWQSAYPQPRNGARSGGLSRQGKASPRGAGM